MAEDSPAQGSPPASTQSREFWLMIGYAVLLGVLGAFVGLVFLGVIKVGSRWFQATNLGWFGGKWWWVAVTAGAGLLVGILHHLMKLPDKTPGVLEDLHTGRADPGLVPGILVVSAVSLMGGASLGPEKALGSTVGGAAAWISKRRRLSEDQIATNTFSGFAAAYGGLLSSPVIVVMFILELARPGGKRFTRILVNSVVASSVSFGIYFAIAGSVFLDLYAVPKYTFESWQMLVGAALGVMAAVLVMGVVLVVAIMTKAFTQVKVPRVVKPIIGGVIFGLVGVALPLTMFTGSDQLATVLAQAPALGTGLILAMVVGKTLAFAASSASGFVGGPIFPALFIGGTAGVAVNLLIPGIPLGLAFTCMMASVLGALVSAPFTMVLMTALLTQVGALQTAPILLAVVTAFLTMEASQFLVNLKKRATPPAAAAPKN
jgi:H+/Cl- antiporter ClcA